MKATIVLFMLACSMVCGQSRQKQPRQQPAQPVQLDEPPQLLPDETVVDPLKNLGPQRQAQQQPRRGGLRVAVNFRHPVDLARFRLAISKVPEKMRQASADILAQFTTELRAVGDVQVTSDAPEESLDLTLVAAGENCRGDCIVLAIVNTYGDAKLRSISYRAITKDNAWIAEFVHEFNGQVLEGDRKRLFR